MLPSFARMFVPCVATGMLVVGIMSAVKQGDATGLIMCSGGAVFVCLIGIFDYLLAKSFPDVWIMTSYSARKLRRRPDLASVQKETCAPCSYCGYTGHWATSGPWWLGQHCTRLFNVVRCAGCFRYINGCSGRPVLLLAGSVLLLQVFGLALCVIVAQLDRHVAAALSCGLGFPSSYWFVSLMQSRSGQRELNTDRIVGWRRLRGPSNPYSDNSDKSTITIRPVTAMTQCRIGWSRSTLATRRRTRMGTSGSYSRRPTS